MAAAPRPAPPARGDLRGLDVVARAVADRSARPKCASRGRRSRPASARSPAPATPSQAANEVLKITIIAFDAGATTNIEVIDAQRSARDQELVVAQAEDAAAPGAARPARRARPVSRSSRRLGAESAALLDREQLDLEQQRRVARNGWRAAGRSVAEVRRNDDPPHPPTRIPLTPMLNPWMTPCPTRNRRADVRIQAAIEARALIVGRGRAV